MGELLRTELVLTRAVCMMKRERWEGEKKRGQSTEPEGEHVGVAEEEGMRDTVTPCSHKDCILIYAYASL